MAVPASAQIMIARFIAVSGSSPLRGRAALNRSDTAIEIGGKCGARGALGATNCVVSVRRLYFCQDRKRRRIVAPPNDALVRNNADKNPGIDPDEGASRPIPRARLFTG